MTRPSDEGRCDICGEPMPEGESMFRIHGYSGPCPKPPLPQPEPINWQERAERAEDALRREMEVQEALRSANSSLAEAAICHGDRANGLWTCPKAPCDYCLHYQRERAERAEADVREMVKKAIENRLDGYRELAQRVADAERDRDSLRVLLREAKTAIIESLTMCRDLSKSLPRRADVDLVMVARTLAKIEHACARIDALLKDKP